jgi:hypothetical protein
MLVAKPALWIRTRGSQIGAAEFESAVPPGIAAVLKTIAPGDLETDSR